MDKISKAQRSKNMAAVRTRNTSPELFVQKALRKNGFKFKTDALGRPGRPDLILPSKRMAIFVHGCFWHGHACKRGRLPKSNVKFWRNKIEKNKKRDRLAIAALKRQGWSVRVLWQCSLQAGITRLSRHLQE